MTDTKFMEPFNNLEQLNTQFENIFNVTRSLHQILDALAKLLKYDEL
jgi:hypothetical protein